MCKDTYDFTLERSHLAVQFVTSQFEYLGMSQQRGRDGKGVVFTTTQIEENASTSTLVTLLRPLIRRFAMIISAWCLRASCEFSRHEFEEIHRNID